MSRRRSLARVSDRERMDEARVRRHLYPENRRRVKAEPISTAQAPSLLSDATRGIFDYYRRGGL